MLSNHLWHWRHEGTHTIVFDNIIDLIHQERLKQYLDTRDGYRLRAHALPFWSGSASLLPLKFVHPKPQTISECIRHTCRVFNKGYDNGYNRAKGLPANSIAHSTALACSQCKKPDSQMHMCLECEDPAICAIREQAVDAYHDKVRHLQATSLPPLSEDTHKALTNLGDIVFRPNGFEVERFWTGTLNHASISQFHPHPTRLLSPALFQNLVSTISKLSAVLTTAMRAMISTRASLYRESLGRSFTPRHRAPQQQRPSYMLLNPLSLITRFFVNRPLASHPPRPLRQTLPHLPKRRHRLIQLRMIHRPDIGNESHSHLSLHKLEQFLQLNYLNHTHPIVSTSSLINTVPPPRPLPSPQEHLSIPPCSSVPDVTQP
jgi:hypothetical protein